MTRFATILRRSLAAVALVAFTGAATLPAPAFAKVEGQPAAAAETFGDGKTKARTTKCGYIQKAQKKYEPKHVKIKVYKDAVDCLKVFKEEAEQKRKLKKKSEDLPVILRGFAGETTDEEVRRSVSDSANKGGAKAGA